MPRQLADGSAFIMPWRNLGGKAHGSLREILADAVRYWERRRVPHFRSMLHFRALLLMFVVATAANVCYCAAYFADLLCNIRFFDQAGCAGGGACG
jgi:hypothetical protein